MNDSDRKLPDRAVRVEDVARVAGVSPITVSRALRTPEKVKQATLERVLEAVKETGYQINSIASSLRSGQTAFVIVFVASLQNPHFAVAMQGVLDAFEGSRYHLMFAQTGYDEDLSVGRIKSMLPFKPAAILFTGLLRDEGARGYLKSLNIPIMEMWGETQAPVDMLVTSPGHEGGRMLGEHFGQQGFKRIAYVGHTSSRSSPRIEGFREGLTAHGRDISLLLPMEGTREMEDGLAALEKILLELPDCDAILFGSDVMAAGALVRAKELGIDVPGKLALAGYGDLFFAAHTQPQLTSVRIFDYEIGETAGKMLLKRLHGHELEKHIIQVPLRLEVRGSTRRH